MKSGKRILIIIGSVAVAIILIVSIGFGVISKITQDALEKQVNVDINMGEVRDGVYTGTSDGGLVQAEVEVTVENHKLADVRIIEHRNGQGRRAETIVHDMVVENTYDVDTVSGATISSKTIKNAVNQALQKGVE